MLGAKKQFFTKAAAGVSVPTPQARFDWHEGSGASTASTVPGGYSLAVNNWTYHDGVGIIAPSGNVPLWTISVNLHLNTVPGDFNSVWYIASTGPYLGITAGGAFGIYNKTHGAVNTSGNHELTTVWDNTGTEKLYLDGVPVGTDNAGYSWDGSNALNVMKDGHPDAIVNHIRFWSSALTAPQVAAL